MGKHNDKQLYGMNRRDFLKAAGMGATIGALAPIAFKDISSVFATTVTEQVKTGIKERTYIRDLGFALGSNVTAIDVKDGKILRLKPFHFDWKYDREHYNPGRTWKIEARGKTFEPTNKSLTTPLSLTYKKRTYSPNRIKYPLKRVDWDPNGERNPQNRGKSKYVRISWDEATDIIANEIRRVHKEYGPYSALPIGGMHGETMNVHSAHGNAERLFAVMGNYTTHARNADSWEGWYWGARHVWGMEPVGKMNNHSNLYPDIAENTDMLMFWGCDPETTTWGWGGQLVSRICYWFKELGIKNIYVCPDLNYGAAIHADKWIPVLPNTDAALHLAISYVWITEDTYDKEYVRTHTVGFDKYKDYVLGKEDGTPKTPEWASPITGVPIWTIKALARQWAKQITSIIHGNGGSYVRGPYSHEPARLEVLNLGMQGWGKPGANQATTIEFGLIPEENSPVPKGKVRPRARGASFRRIRRANKQIVAKTLLSEAILEHSFDNPVSWYSRTGFGGGVNDQFVKYTYPIPKEEGGSELHLIWSDCPCHTVCWNGGNRFVEALRSPKIECFITQHPWMEDDCMYSDIILPSNTNFEVEDLGADIMSGQFHTLFRQRQCIEPVGESKSNMECVAEVAKKLGVYEKFTDGKTVEDLIKKGFDESNVQDMITWEEFNEKDYYVVPTDPNWKDRPVSMTGFYEDPDSHPLTTPSGKLEYYSQRLADNFPDDGERRPVPQYIAEGETHKESKISKRAEKYPLLLVSNHPRWRVHAEHDDISWLREIETCKVKGPDGYLYEPIWLHPSDAEERGIKHGDIVSLFNERGVVLGGAYITERLIPGAVYQDHGARVDSILPGKIDRGGSNNLIAPNTIISKNCAGMATSGFLVQVDKTDMKELKKNYPQAFKGEYDPATGPNFFARVTKGE